MTKQHPFTIATENGTEVIDLADLTTQELRDLRSEAGSAGDHDGVELINAAIDDRS